MQLRALPLHASRPRMLMGGLALLGILGLTCLGTSGSADAKDDAFAGEKKRYKAYLGRPSFHMRHRGRETFAKTGDLRALKILTASYARPDKPKPQVRYLLASLCAENFKSPEALELMGDWRKQNMRPRDAWLWYRTLMTQHEVQGSAELLRVIKGTDPMLLRMASLAALGAGRDPELLGVHAELLAAPPRSGAERNLVLRSAADALYALRTRRLLDPWQGLAKQVITALDDDTVTPATRLIVARRLAAVYGTDVRYLSATPWLATLAGRKPDAGVADKPEALARFLGMEATGQRIAYVIDLSDSMLDPVSVREIKDLAKLAALPWDKIVSRFDAARELLRASLKTLGSKQSYCVITFGSEAKLLKATPGLRRATPALAAKVMRELDALKAGPPKKGRPHGTLGGYTNLHGGLQRAFELKGSGRIKAEAYVDPDAFEAGCDTIFLLSDGEPTWDDYPTVDTLEKQDDPGDPETGFKSTESKTATFYGPYAIVKWLRDDLRRMNLFRRVEIHCVGLGEYDPHLLVWLAHVGHGELRRIGDAPKKKTKKKKKKTRKK